MSKILISDLFADLPVIETERLRIRKLSEADAEDMFAYASDSEVTRHLIWNTHESIEDTLLFIRSTLSAYSSGEPGTWGIEFRETGKLIGTIGLHNWKPESRRIETGYVISKELWGRGIVPEALSAVIKLIFEKTDINRIEAYHFTGNEKSGRVMEKCGMKYEGTLREYVYCKGSFRDVRQYSILKREYIS